METKNITQQDLLADENLLCSFTWPRIAPNVSCYMLHTGGKNLRYSFWWNDVEIFSRQDYNPPVFWNVDDVKVMVDLLGWLCMRMGDTDSEFFETYTPNQLKWSESQECEFFRDQINDFESSDGTSQQEAVKFFENLLKTY